MHTKHVIVEDYNQEWKNEFERIKNELLTVLSGKINSIEHVGSTSVQGLAAKPIIDIDVVIDKNFEEVKEALELGGYIYEGDLGIYGREAFGYKNKPHLMVHHLYVCNKDNEELYRHITFRDYLRKDTDAVKYYSSVKKEGARLYPYNIDKYIEYKTGCILELYKRCGLE